MPTEIVIILLGWRCGFIRPWGRGKFEDKRIEVRLGYYIIGKKPKLRGRALRKEELSSGCKTDCEDALLILPGRKRIRSEPSSALNQVNNEHNDGNHEQKMDQTAAKVADKAQKPEHH